MRKLIVLFFFCLSITASAKKTNKYPVATIAKELLSKSDAVIRHREEVVTINENLTFTTEVRYAITIMKESGEKKAYFAQGYNKLFSISDIEGTVYDRDGKKVKSIKNDDILDYSAVEGIALYSDTRAKLIDPKQSEYPFTVEYSYSVKYKSLMYLPSFLPMEHYDTAVEFSKITYRVPEGYDFRFKEQNLPVSVNKSQDDGLAVYSWEVSNQKAISYESMSPSIRQWFPKVEVSPSRLTFKDHSGDFSTWKGFGELISSLNKGRDYIPEETIEKVRALLKPEMTDKEKIAEIYKYSQKKNRYILIVEGIGGLQPFEAETVDEVSYGDCKALSNYTVALLRAFGYDAHYVIVRAGSDEHYIDDSFTANRFNHAIACVDLPDERIWLECTNPYAPAGYIGDFTDDRFVVVVTENGGELVKTPAYSLEDNTIVTEAVFHLTKNGHAAVETEMVYKGANYSDEFYLTLMDEKDRTKKITKSIECPNAKNINYELDEVKEQKPVFTKKIQFDTEKLASIAGKRMFLEVNNLNKKSYIPNYSRSRKSKMEISREYGEKDHVVYEIPEGVSVEGLPDPVSIESDFGRYSATASVQDGKLVYNREYQLHKGLYAKEKYNEFVEFKEKVVQADKAKVVLKIE